VWAWCVGLALVSHAPEHAELFRWAMILDIGGLALRRLGRRFLGPVGVALGSTAILFAGLRATDAPEPLLFAVAAVFGVAIWVYVLGLTVWLWREQKTRPGNLKLFPVLQR
jgi:uncharacterized membrane protein